MPITAATNAMGTRFEFVVDDDEYAADSTRWRSLDDAIRAAIDQIEHWHAALNRFDPASLISFINREGFARPVRVDADLLDLLILCARVQQESDGAFDVCATGEPPPADSTKHRQQGGQRADHAVGPVSRHSSVVRAESKTRVTPVPPDGHRPRFAVDAELGTVRLLDAAARLDLGGVAKGFALDLAARHLRDAGIQCALIHGGTSSVCALGSPPGQPGWRIALGDERDPRAPMVLLRDRSLSVSRPMSPSRAHSGEQAVHLIDPRIGSTVRAEHAPALVAVAADNGALAECWSTAIAVLGHRPAEVPANVITIIAPPPDQAGEWKIEGNSEPRCVVMLPDGD